jgi:hypothetical protein
MLSGA